jgi:cobalamin biosynthesis Mg chelatase CobN
MMRLLTLFIFCGLLCAAAPARVGWVRIAMAENSSVGDAVKTMKDVADKTDAASDDEQKSTTTTTNTPEIKVKPGDPVSTIKKVYSDQDDKSGSEPSAEGDKGSSQVSKKATDAAKKEVTAIAKKNLKSAAKAGVKKLSPAMGGIIIVVGLVIAFAAVGLLRKLAHRIADAINDAD